MRVRSAADPDIDMAALRVECRAGPCPPRTAASLSYGATSGSDWARDGRHATTVVALASDSVTLLRARDSDRRAPGLAHAFDLLPAPGGFAGAASVSCLYAPLRASGELRFPVDDGTS